MTTAEPERIQGIGNSVMGGGSDAHGLPSGRGGGSGGGSKGAPLPHIEDILVIPRDIDRNQSVKKLIEMAETELRHAQMARDFDRPAEALKDYLRASIIAVQTIREHRDYLLLKGDRKDLTEAYNALLRKIRQQDDTFSRIKQTIIADNERSGVKPTVQGPSSQSNGGALPTMTSPRSSKRDSQASLTLSLNGSPQPSVNSSPGRSKPTIQPKPRALHGNTIAARRGSFSAAQNTTQDLAARFANLRGPQASPGQDPRIKTHPLTLVPLKPAGPREMPPSQKPRIGIDSSIPTLPKMPEAIYSPARGSISSEAARLPTSTPRGLYSRTGSSTSLAGTPTGPGPSQNNDYFPTQSYSNNSIPPAPPSVPMKIPEGDVITPEELFQAMKGKGSILLIDVRAREDFDEGHIMSPTSICIEPGILLRENISADEICESLVLSPGKEQSSFEQRDKFDLVVFYDQDSEQIPKSALNSVDLVIISLHRALVYFNYNRDLKNTPKILQGGLDAWVDLMGPASLQATAMPGPQRLGQVERPAGRIIERRKSKYVIKPLKPNDVKVWQETLKNEDMQTASSPTFARTTEDFLRRFPPVITEQESMTSPPTIEATQTYGSSYKVDLDTELPAPPTRPAPAVPRPSFSGLSQKGDDSELYGEANAPPAQRTTGRTPAKSMEQQPTGETAKFYTGLNNPHNWCYANSTLQSLLASPGFGRDLADSLWTSKYKVSRKDDEKIDPPQLMIRIISNLFHWMSTGKFQVMKAQTLLDYCRHLCTASRGLTAIFGNREQQDAQEFMSFLLDNLHDETNTQRQRKGWDSQPNTKDQSILLAAADYWRNYMEYNRSIIDRYWRGIELSTINCLECGTKTYMFTPFHMISVPLMLNWRLETLESVLTQRTSADYINDFACVECKRGTRACQSLSYTRLPALLCLQFVRFHWDSDNGSQRKATATVTWDFNDFDFSPYFLAPEDCAGSEAITDPAFTGPFRYECYAVVVHSGSSSNSGHYMSYVRDPASRDPYAWFFCNDSRVTKVRIGSNDRDDVQNSVFKYDRDRVPYLAFFRRKNFE